MAKAPRVRKALSAREQASATRAKPDSKPSKLARTKGRLTIVGVFSPLRPIFRPFRWLIPTYFVNSWREVRQVTWPTRRETWRLTLAVFIFAVVFGSMVAGVDKVLDLLFKKVILKV